jgi:hypothetical protein
VFSIALVPAQTPDATLEGLVTDPAGRALAGVRIAVLHEQTALSRAGTTNERGEYSFAGLVRGLHRLRVDLSGYKPVEHQGLELAVAERRRLDFTLFPVSAPGEEALVEDFLRLVPAAAALPVETTASSVSVIVDEGKILLLPLATRNIFSLFLLQPGVTSQGAIVRRGLSFSVHGQRVSGSNYLLDGVDNNNSILTGPVVAPSAEAIQEFRMVNSSFSAERGRATAFVAQVATRSGGNRAHGSLFEFLSNDRLNANTFYYNALGTRRQPLRQNQFGYSAQGPVRKSRVFFSSALELSRLRSSGETEVLLPTPEFLAQLRPGSPAQALLAAHPPLPANPTAGDPHVGRAVYRLPGHIDTVLGTHRVDYHTPGGRDRLLVRHTFSSTQERTDRTAQGYPSLEATDHYQAHNALVGWTRWWTNLVHDLRLGWNRERLRRPRPFSEIPILQTLAGVLLPASRRQLDEWENNNVLQISDQWSGRLGRSNWTGGFEYRRNFANSRIAGFNSSDAVGSYGLFPDGFYLFPDLRSFGAGQPLSFAIGVDRFSTSVLRPARPERRYRSADWSGFFQNDARLSRRLSLNLGIRYEYFGVPHNVDGSQDVNFYLGPGTSIEERLAGGELRPTDRNPGGLRHLLYRRDHRNLAPSVGLAWDPAGRSRTVLRAGYAVSLDRIFDAARDPRMNTQQVANCLPQLRCTPRLAFPGITLLPELPPALGPAPAVQIDEGLRTPYVQNWYAGVQQSLAGDTLLEVGHAGSVGRKLISRDFINRTVARRRSLNDRVQDIAFLSNAGNSNYLALEAALRRRFSRGIQAGISYTYSHSIDNQSDVVEGIRIGGTSAEEVTVATFTRPFDAGVDRGNANFDQRHNLVFHAIWDLPRPASARRWLERLAGGWTVSVIGAYRSGFPVTLIGSLIAPSGSELRNNRVDFLGDPARSPRADPPLPVPGGVQWLDRTRFRAAGLNDVGTLGRGAMAGPGFWNYDFALIRHFGRPEARFRVQLRGESYNLFNHANLGPPAPVLNSPDFGRSYYGRSRRISRFGELPLDSPARRIQVAARLVF